MEIKKAKLGPQLHMGEKNPKDTKYEIKNEPGFPKPKNGVWTSTFDKDSGSSWMAWCRSAIPQWLQEKGNICEVKDDVKIAEIDSFEDLENMLDKYGIEKFGIKTIDFEKLAEDYDGLHLTEKGQWKTRLTEPSLYGWDAESTIFFRDVFKSCKPIDLKKWVDKYIEQCEYE